MRCELIGKYKNNKILWHHLTGLAQQIERLSLSLFGLREGKFYLSCLICVLSGHVIYIRVRMRSTQPKPFNFVLGSI